MRSTKRVIVHIGYHKTASTWFQQQYYPKVADATYLPREIVLETFCKPYQLDYDPTMLLEAIESAERDTVILCHEELSGNIHSGGLNGHLSVFVADQIAELFANVQVVVFIRNQVSMIASIYRQYVKEGGTYSVQRYLDHAMRDYGYRQPLFTWEHLQYDKLAAYYAQAVGEERLHIFPFEAFVADIPAFLPTYETALQIHADGASLDYSKANTAIPDYLLPIARWLNQFSFQNMGYKRVLLNLDTSLLFLNNRVRRQALLKRIADRLPLSQQSSTERLLGAEIIAQIKAYYAESNQRLVDDFGLNLVSYGYPL